MEIKIVGAGLLAKVECQSLNVLLIHRLREQARSHIFDRVSYSKADAGPKNSYRLCFSGTPKAFK